MNIPRIRGRVGQGDDKKWYFEITMWNFEGTKQVGEPIGSFGPWKSKKESLEKLQAAVELAVKALTKNKANGYVDFKNGGQFTPFKAGQ